jgi:hypothetical protein
MQVIGWQQAAQQQEHADVEHPKVKQEAGVQEGKTYDKGCACLPALCRAACMQHSTKRLS